METTALYNNEDLKSMRLADTARLPGKNRVEELRNYARLSGMKRIGIAHCVAVQKQADLLKQTLSDEFEVFTVGCKYGQIPAADILGNNAKGISCNPAGQAGYLADQGTELNIVMGLCVGHDMVFTSKSAAPSTTLVVKDREFKNNTLEFFQQ